MKRPISANKLSVAWGRFSVFNWRQRRRGRHKGCDKIANIRKRAECLQESEITLMRVIEELQAKFANLPKPIPLPESLVHFGDWLAIGHNYAGEAKTRLHSGGAGNVSQSMDGQRWQLSKTQAP